jgi:hypothetical protein
MIGTHGYEMPGFLAYIGDYFSALLSEMSFLVPLCLAGLIFVVRSKGRKIDTFSWSMIALLAVTPIGLFAARVLAQPRYLILPYVAVIFFVGEFWSWIAGPSRRGVLMIGTLVLFLVLQWMDVNQPHFRQPPVGNLSSAVTFIEARDGNEPGSVLVPSTFEGPWIAEFAAKEADRTRPRRMVVRPTKVLGQEDWNGSAWHPSYDPVGGLGPALQRFPVKYCILLDSPREQYLHDKMLESTVAGHPQSWHIVFQENGRTNAFRIYENAGWSRASEVTVYREVKKALQPTVSGID